ncbi:NADP-dependent oxidoreductase domain-containing protein [Plasmodiophora brassicae]
MTGTAPMAMPPMLYGTAWKADRTSRLVVQAVLAGFRGIDTACQPKHYNEAGVGDALETLAKAHGIARESLYVQTKFTSLAGQDRTKPLPYDPNASLTDQVHQSVQTSLTNLRTTYLDGLNLHGPLPTHRETMEVWRAMEAVHQAGTAKSIGVSNFYSLGDFRSLVDDAVVKPAVLQNRFYADTGYDVELRRDVVLAIAGKMKVTPEQVWFRFLIDLGIVPLSGTTNEQHMRDDVAVHKMGLAEDDTRRIATLFPPNFE